MVWMAENIGDADEVDGVRANAAELSVTILVEVAKIKEGTTTDGWEERLVPGRFGTRMIPRRCMITRKGPAAPNLKSEAEVSNKAAKKKQEDTAVYWLSTEERFTGKWADVKAKPTQNARRWLAEQLSREEAMKVGGMWGFEIDKTDGKVITGLVRVNGNVNIARTSGAKARKGRFDSLPSRSDGTGRQR